MVEKDVALSAYTSFQLGGRASWLVSCSSQESFIGIVRLALFERIPFFLLGGGSNLVISDQGLDRLVIRFVSPRPDVHVHETTLQVSGGTILDHVVSFAAQQGLSGLNYASGIPGTVAGAIIGNAGAYGQQVGDVLEHVSCINAEGRLEELSAKDLDLSYRHSNLKGASYGVVSATFRMTRGDRAALLKERSEHLAQRARKHPCLLQEPCAGSLFRNIEPSSAAERRQAAGWFLEQTGAKTLSIGGARVFAKHANIIVKDAGCTSQDVYDLSCEMMMCVKRMFGFDLVREVQFIGDFQPYPRTIHTMSPRIFK